MHNTVLNAQARKRRKITGDASSSDPGDPSSSEPGDPSSSDDFAEDSSQATGADVPGAGVPDAILATPLHELARRERFGVDRTRESRSRYCINVGHVPSSSSRALDFCRLQDLWDSLICKVHGQCTEKFWRYFLPFHTFSGTVIDTALLAAKRTFRDNKKNSKFPASRRTLFNKLRFVDEFWIHVRHAVRIDLRAHALPSGTQFLEFEFVDPFWAWIVSARRQPPESLHWLPARRDTAQHPLYGGGIQYGNAFHEAYHQCPPGSFNMHLTLHWDGTFGKGLELTPIAVGNANTNICESSKEFCIAYIPVTPDQKMSEYAKTKRCTK